jgi:hypothetical protein
MQGRIRIAIACTGVLLTTAANARAQTTYRETGSVTTGGYLVWVRGTNASSVELFVGRGFRDAFAHAHEMDAAKLQHWIDSVRLITPVAVDDTTTLDKHGRGAALGTDVTLMRRVGGAHSGLRLLVDGEQPIQMAEATAHDFIVILDSAARVSLEMSKPAPSMMVGIPAPDVAPAPAPAPAPAVATVAEMSAPMVAPMIAPIAASVSTPPVTPIAAPPMPAAVAPMGPSTAESPPELVLPAPAEPVILLASRVEIMPLPLPQVPVPAATPLVAEPVVAEPVVAPAPDSAIPPHIAAPADKLIRTPLGPFTVPGALLGDRDRETQYCYTQLGLKYNPDLKGEITLKLTLASDGTVQDAVVSKRSWQGISAGEVESCVRALARDWSFASSDPTIVDGAKLLTFNFAP